jgi:small subunit ribosomal protein S3
MGQKVHPYGFRLGVTKTWRSRWFAKHDYARLLEEDLGLKKMLRGRLKSAGISSIEIDRPGNKLRITIRTSRPGIIIGRKGSEIEKLKADLAKRTKRDVYIDIQEVHKPELDAQLVTESIAMQLLKRVAFRRAMRKAVDSALRFGCKGIKVRVSGRLNGAEIARSEWYLQGQLPLHTLRADIDYGFSEAFTTYGVIGVKCWIYKGEILDNSWHPTLNRDPEPRRMPRRDRDRDRRPPRAAAAPAPVAEPAAPAGPPTQAAPGELPKPAEQSQQPIMPPLAAPKPAWKEEAQAAPPAAAPAAAPAEAPAPAAEPAPEAAAPEAPPAPPKAEASPEPPAAPAPPAEPETKE